MELLKYTILEVHSEKACIGDWTKEYPKMNFLEVDVTCNVNGNELRSTYLFNDREWELRKEFNHWLSY